jgi:hypothetical protein
VEEENADVEGEEDAPMAMAMLSVEAMGHGTKFSDGAC